MLRGGMSSHEAINQIDSGADLFGYWQSDGIFFRIVDMFFWISQIVKCDIHMAIGVANLALVLIQYENALPV